MVQHLHYHPRPDQRELAESYWPTLTGLLPLSRLHSGSQESPQAWSELVASGLFQMALPIDQGGSGLGATETTLIVLELGRCLAAPSVLATLGASLLRSAELTETGPADGRCAAGYVSPQQIVLVQDSKAEFLLLRDGERASLHPLRGHGEVLDEYTWGVSLHRLDLLAPALAQISGARLRLLWLQDAAQLAGIADLACRMAVAYAAERQQFGRPIGSFQAIKHHCANMAMLARSAIDQVCFAAVAVDEARPDAGMQVDCALQVAAVAALRNAATNIQVHGGLGTSDEAHPHRLLKRARLSIELLGGLEPVIDRIAGACASRQASHERNGFR
ncbi:MAG: acyl-CoA dehydrogenase family protein [Lysobacterales bacterium]